MRILVFLTLFLPSIIQAQSIQWETVIPVNENIDFGYARPKIALNGNGDPVVMWGKTYNENAYVSVLQSGDFSTPSALLPDGMNAYVQNWTAPSMEAQGDLVFVVFKSQPDDQGYIYIVKSINGGLTFGDTVRVSNERWSKFPEVSILPNGNPVVNFMKFEPGFLEPHYAVAVSADGGNTFSEPVDASSGAPGEACDCCPGFVLAEQDRIIVMFRNNDNNLRDMWATVSTDGGQSFDQGADVDYNNWMINSCPSTGPNAISKEDSLYAVWMSGAQGFSKVNIASVNLNDMSVGVTGEITPNRLTNQNYPKIDGENNVMGVIWQEVDEGMDIKMMVSKTGVQGLLGGSVIDVNVFNTGTQTNPDMVFKDGYFHTVWQDNKSKAIYYRKGKFDLSSSVEQINISDISVQPNPFVDQTKIQIQNAEEYTLEVFDGTGKRMNFNAQYSSDAIVLKNTNWVPGLYLMQLYKRGKVVFTDKLLVGEK